MCKLSSRLKAINISDIFLIYINVHIYMYNTILFGKTEKIIVTCKLKILWMDT